MPTTMSDSNAPKTPAPDPEIPDELKNRLSRPKRPDGFYPKSGEAEEDNAPEERPVEGKVRNLGPFFKKVALAMKGGKFFREIVEMKDVQRDGEWIREERKIKVPVKLFLGEDGIPYTAEPVTAAETNRIRGLQYADAPKQEPQFGDLTPAFAEWLYLNHPYDAAVRYATRSTHIHAWAVARA
jgi:hypothetical protein